jgi:hypothetical protein
MRIALERRQGPTKRAQSDAAHGSEEDMGFKVVRTTGDGEWGERLDACARHLFGPSREEWALGIEAGGAGLRLVASGPRGAHNAPDWVSAREARGSRWTHRRDVGSLADRTPEALADALNALVWSPVRVVSDAIRRSDPALARAFERAVLGEMQDERLEPLVIRFGVWIGEEDGPRYLCKVERAPESSRDGGLAWRWWSPLVREPQELAQLLRAALRARRREAAAPAHAREFWGWGSAGQAGA